MCLFVCSVAHRFDGLYVKSYINFYTGHPLVILMAYKSLMCQRKQLILKCLNSSH